MSTYTARKTFLTLSYTKGKEKEFQLIGLGGLF